MWIALISVYFSIKAERRKLEVGVLMNGKPESGLTTAEVNELQRKYGKNELISQKKESFAKKYTTCWTS